MANVSSSKLKSSLPGGPKPTLFVALRYDDASGEYYQGTLEKIAKMIDEDTTEVNDYTFYVLGQRVDVELKKELVCKTKLTVV